MHPDAGGGGAGQAEGVRQRHGQEVAMADSFNTLMDGVSVSSAAELTGKLALFKDTWKTTTEAWFARREAGAASTRKGGDATAAAPTFQQGAGTQHLLFLPPPIPPRKHRVAHLPYHRHPK